MVIIQLKSNFYLFLGFWLRSDTYVEQPSVRFKHKYLMLSETDGPDGLIICSTFDELNLQLQKQSRCSLVKVIIIIIDKILYDIIIIITN